MNCKKTFEEIFSQWFTVYKLSLKPVSAYRIEQMATKHLLPYFGSLYIAEITDTEIAGYVESKLKDGNRLTHEPLCQNTVSRHIGLINTILSYAQAYGYITRNPAAMIKLKKTPCRKYGIFNPEEVRNLIKVARPHWMGDIILVAYRTGMRRGEIYGLKWDDIDFERKCLSIGRTVECYNPQTKFITTPKTSSANRIIMLDNQVLDMLHRRFEKRTSDEWVYANQYGQLMSPWYNTKYFRDACKNIGVVGKRFHDLRHTHITELVLAGIDLPIIQQRAGHSRIDMTLHYTHISPSAQQSAVDYLNKR